MSKAKVITLDSTPNTPKDTRVFAIIIGTAVNSIWDDLDTVRDEADRLENLGNQDVRILQFEPNTRYPSLIEQTQQRRSVVMTSPGVFRDNQGNTFSVNQEGEIGVTRINSENPQQPIVSRSSH